MAIKIPERGETMHGDLIEAFVEAARATGRVRHIAVRPGARLSFVVTIAGDWRSGADQLFDALEDLRDSEGERFDYRTVKDGPDRRDPSEYVVFYTG